MMRQAHPTRSSCTACRRIAARKSRGSDRRAAQSSCGTSREPLHAQKALLEYLVCGRIESVGGRDDRSQGISVSKMTEARRSTSGPAPLGYDILMEWDTLRRFGVAPKPDFWIAEGAPTCRRSTWRSASRRGRSRCVFTKRPWRPAAADNGAPGIRTHYHPNYYGAFVLDPDGHNIEAVCHSPA
jgi:hypothetical protein